MKSAKVVAIVLLTFFLPLMAMPVKAYYEGFTHAVYVESVVRTGCEYCQGELPLLSEAHQKYKGSLHFVEFHFNDEWATEHAMDKIKEYNIRGTPTHAYDAGFIVKVGAIDQGKIELAGKRPVHKVTLAISKNVQGNQLTFEGHIKEEDGEPFNGKIVVIGVDNEGRSRGFTWNDVFRAYLLQQNISLAGGEYKLFSGSWSIPGNVYVPGVELIAVAYDFADKSDRGSPLPIQSVSDETSGVVIPEFGSALAAATIAIIASIIILRIPRRRHTNGCNQNVAFKAG